MKNLFLRTLLLAILCFSSNVFLNAQSSIQIYYVNLNLESVYPGMTIKIIEDGGSIHTHSIGNKKAASIRIYSRSCTLEVTDKNGFSNSYWLDLNMQGGVVNEGMNLEVVLGIKYAGGKPYIYFINRGNVTPPSGGSGGGGSNPPGASEF